MSHSIPRQFNPLYMRDQEFRELEERRELLLELSQTFQLLTRIRSSNLIDPPKLRRTLVKVADDRMQPLLMDHWHISSNGTPLLSPLWRRVVLNEHKWLPGQLWIREDGELVTSMIFNTEQRSVSRPVQQSGLSIEAVRLLRQRLARMREAVIVSQR